MTGVGKTICLLATMLAPAAAPLEDERCAGLKDVTFPDADRPTEAEKAELRGCDAEDLYYGITRARDVVKARLCAYAQIDAGEQLVFGGEAILMMIYAQGLGVNRDPDLAMRLACRYGGAQMEVSGRLDHLQEMSIAQAPATFDICDDITSGYMMGFCDGHLQRFAIEVCRRRWHEKFENWTPQERRAFERVRKAADAFFQARFDREIDLSGTARASLIIEEEEILEESLIDLVEKLDGGTLPSASRAEHRVAVKGLKHAYTDFMRSTSSEVGTVKKEGVRQAQREWLRYRDAWSEFARTKYPGTSWESVQTWLVRQRTRQLER